jgi:teichoic acid transport system permease protein
VVGASPVILLSERRGLGAYLAEVWRRRDFAWNLAMAKVHARNSSTTLGLFWWVLDPLLLGGVFLLVFGVILKTARGDPNYIGFLLSGLFVFTYTRETMTAGAASITTNAQLIGTKRFPRLLLPLSSVMEWFTEFAFSLIPFFLIAGLTHGDWPGVHTWVLAPALVLQTMFNLGLSLLMAELVVPIRDIGNLVNYLSRIWLYLSPVIFPLDERLQNAPAVLVNILRANPMACILGLYRGALLGRQIEPYHWWGTAAWAVGLLVVGVLSFRRVEPKLPRYLD